MITYLLCCALYSCLTMHVLGKLELLEKLQFSMFDQIMLFLLFIFIAPIMLLFAVIRAILFFVKGEKG